MRIYSKFKDYYDIFPSMKDDPVVFNRHTKTYSNRRNHDEADSLSDADTNTYKLSTKDKNELSHKNYVESIFLSMKHESKVCEYVALIAGKTHRFGKCGNKANVALRPYILFTDRDKVIDIAEHADDIHRYFNSPVILYHRNKLYINPQLSKFGFASIIDPYTMYQDIEMYISNVLTSYEDPDDLVMDEKTKLQSKGMDKWSFKTMPNDSKKKRRR